MGVAEELSRLVELRDRGVLTQKEFDRKKKQILNGGRGSSRFMTWVAGLVAFMILAGVAVKLFERFASPIRISQQRSDIKQWQTCGFLARR